MSKANSGMTLHTLVSQVTVSHMIVILLILTCQLAPKSNSHISLLLLRVYINQHFSNAYSVPTCAAMYPDLY